MPPFYRMETLNHCLEGVSRFQVLTEVVRLSGVEAMGMERWFDDPGMEKLIHAICFDPAHAGEKPEDACQLILALKEKIPVHKYRLTEVYSALGRLQLWKGNPVNGRKYFKKVEKIENSSFENVSHYWDGESDFDRVADGSSETYRQLQKQQNACNHSYDWQCRYKEILEFKDKLANDLNPCAHRYWVYHLGNMINLSQGFMSVAECDHLITLTEKAITHSEKLNCLLLIETIQTFLTCISKPEIMAEVEGVDIDTLERELKTLRQLEKASQGTEPEQFEKTGLKGFRLARVDRPCKPGMQKNSLVAVQNCTSFRQQVDLLLACLSGSQCDPVELTQVIVPLFETDIETLPENTGELLKRLARYLTDAVQTSRNYRGKMRSQLAFSHISRYLKANNKASGIKKLESRHKELLAELKDEYPEIYSTELSRSYGDKDYRYRQRSQLVGSAFADQLEFIIDYLNDAAEIRVWLDRYRGLEVPVAQWQALEEKYAEYPNAFRNAKVGIYRKYLKGENVRELLLTEIRKPTRWTEDKIELLVTGVELGIIKPDEILSIQPSLKFKDSEKKFLACFLITDKKRLLTALPEWEFHDSYYKHQLILGQKLVKLGELTTAFRLLERLSDDHDFANHVYALAMMEWKHDQGSRKQKSQKVCPRLIRAAGNHHISAQCRLLDWVLENKTDDAVVKQDCFRYLTGESLISSDERTFYQGMALYTGTGCDINKELGLVKIRAAMASDSPIPALRLALLTQRKCLNESEVSEVSGGSNPFLMFVEKLTGISPDEKLDLLLSCRRSELEAFVTHLTSLTSKHPEKTRLLEKAGNELSNLLEQWVPTEVVVRTLGPDELEWARGFGRSPAVVDEVDFQQQREEQLRTELDHQVFGGEKSDPARVVKILLEMQAIQGEMFPDFPERAIAVLMGFVPLTCQENSQLAIRLFMTIKSRVLQKTVLSKMLSHFLFKAVRVELKLNPETSLDFEVETLGQLLQEKKVDAVEHQEAFMALVEHQTSRGELTRNVIATMKTWTTDVLGQALNQFSQLSAESYPWLYSEYFERFQLSELDSERYLAMKQMPFAEEDNLLGLALKVWESDTRINQALLFKVIDLLIRIDPPALVSRLLDHPNISVRDKWDLFKRMPLTIKRLLAARGLPENLCDHLWEEVSSNPIKPVAVSHLEEHAEGLLQKGTSFRPLLDCLMALGKKHTAPDLVQSVKGATRKAAKKLLEDVPLKQWDGNSSRLLAQAFINRL